MSFLRRYTAVQIKHKQTCYPSNFNDLRTLLNFNLYWLNTLSISSIIILRLFSVLVFIRVHLR